MKKGTVKHIKSFQILGSFRNIVLSVPTTFAQDCSVLSISFNIYQIIYIRGELCAVRTFCRDLVISVSYMLV